VAERRRADEPPPERLAGRAPDTLARDRVARIDAKRLATIAIQHRGDDAALVLLDRRLLVVEEQRHVCGGLAVSLEDRLEHDLRRDAAGTRGRAAHALDVVGVVGGAEDAELVSTQPCVE
jgi:hypothetical protein